MSKNETVVVLGTFDGVHMGHRSLISHALKKARVDGKRCIIYTFSNHPMSLFCKTPRLLMTADERIKELEKTGVDEVVADEFNFEIANMSPLDFVKMLKMRFNMSCAVAGYNYSFGKGGKGSVETLKALGKEEGISVIVCDKVLYEGESVSSTRIRECIENGDIINANAMLKDRYSLSGKVVANKHIGTKIGFPTANIEADFEKVLPKAGVYATSVTVFNKQYNSVTNIGTNPTVFGDKLTIETHIIGFDENIYGENITVEFIDYIRSDKRFNSLEELKEQIKKDIAYFF